MALILADRVRENTTVQGTNSATLLGSPIGFETFSARIGDGNTTYYTIAEKTGDNWEVGVGTYRSAGNLLERTTVLSSSNGGNKVAFAAGDKDVFVTLPAEKVVSTDAAGTMAYQNANAVAITGGAIDGTTIGSTTSAAATFTTLIGGKDQANYGQLTGGATTKAVEFRTLGSDTNIACAIRSKGTGAIDLAAGSSGVNISNGGTVTGITRTAVGSNYTTAPTVAITAPTTAGGVQATATIPLIPTVIPTITSGGTGYTVGDVLTFVGGTGTAAQFTVSTVSGGVITGIASTNTPAYTVVPSNPISVTGGTGSGATFTVSSWSIGATFTITNAGSGYVEQPTVTFSGGGGSGAAAYATVGSGTVVRSLGSTMDFYTPNGSRALNLYESTASSGTGYWSLGSGTTNPYMWARGGTNVDGRITSSGTGALNFFTNSGGQEQFRVAHTANAVNYVQVTGAATGSKPSITAQGSDSVVGLLFNTKSIAFHEFQVGSRRAFQIGYTTASDANYAQIVSNAAGSAPILSVAGTDTNIDLALTPKGTGLVRFGTYTAGVLTPAGYITVKDSAGNTRRLLVG